MDTFTVRLPRRPMRLFGRSPLVRTSDRVEALILVLAVLMSVLSAPIAAAVGTAVHDSSRQRYAEQAHTRHSITATVTDDNAALQEVLPTNTITVAAQWSAAGAVHTGTVEAASTAKPGDLIQIWVDDYGAQVGRPTPTTHAAVEAVTAALVIWLCVTAAAVTLFAGTRIVCARIRFTGWQHDLDSLVGHGNGHTTSQP